MPINCIHALLTVSEARSHYQEKPLAHHRARLELMLFGSGLAMGR